MSLKDTATHYQDLEGRRRTRTASEKHPIDPETGQEIYNKTDDIWEIYNGSVWYGTVFTTTTSTSTSTTTTSTSTTTTSTSTSTSTSISTSTSTSTTTTI